MQYTKPHKLFHRFRVLASNYCSPANFECDSGFRVYFLVNSFAKHCSSNLQLLLDCSVQYIDRKFKNQNVTKETNKNPKSKICPVDRRRKTATICMYYVSKRGPNICKKQITNEKNSSNGDISPVILLVTSSQSNLRAMHPISRVHASNITCQRLSSPHNNSECISCIPN